MSTVSTKASQRKSQNGRETEHLSISERFWKAQRSTKCFQMMVKNPMLGWVCCWLGFCWGQERLDRSVFTGLWTRTAEAAEDLSYFASSNVPPHLPCNSCFTVLAQLLQMGQIWVVRDFTPTGLWEIKKAEINLETIVSTFMTSQLKLVFHWTSNFQGRSAPTLCTTLKWFKNVNRREYLYFMPIFHHITVTK